MFSGRTSYILAPLQVQTWQYILVAYCHLEALALDVLRLHQGIDAETFWKDPHKLPTLHQAATLLSPHHRVSPETIRTLQAVANLRNSVAHKGPLVANGQFLAVARA